MYPHRKVSLPRIGGQKRKRSRLGSKRFLKCREFRSIAFDGVVEPFLRVSKTG